MRRTRETVRISFLFFFFFFFDFSYFVPGTGRSPDVVASPLETLSPPQCFPTRRPTPSRSETPAGLSPPRAATFTSCLLKPATARRRHRICVIYGSARRARLSNGIPLRSAVESSRVAGIFKNVSRFRKNGKPLWSVFFFSRFVSSFSTAENEPLI